MTLFVSTIKASRTLDIHEDVLLCDATSGDITLTLPPAKSRKGKTYLIWQIDSSTNTVTLDAHSSELIDDETTLVLKVPQGILCDGTQWWSNHRSLSTNIPFTATDFYSHSHSKGAKPAVSVIDSDGFEVGVCVQHLDDDTVELSFPGETLTGATLVLS